MLLSNMELFATAPGGVAKLRELILTLAVQGKLVPQDPADEPAGVLLQKIRAEKDRLIAEGKIKRDKPLAAVGEEDCPFEAPNGWEWVTFGVIAGIERGGSPRPIESFLTDDPHGLNWIKIGDTDKGGKYITSTREKIRREGLAKTRMVFPGDFLLTNSMSFGRPYITQIEGCIHDGWLRISPPSSLNKDYLFALLSSQFIRQLFVAAAAGGVVQNLNADKVRNVPIPLPPLAEQSRIVTRVEALMRLCDALEAKGQLEAAQHAQLVSTLLGTLTASATPEELADNWQRVAQHFDLLLDRPEAIAALEQTLLQLAVRGLLVPQDPTEEPASALLQKIRAEKDRLIATGQIKRDKPLPPITDEEKPFELPVGWEWVPLQHVGYTQTGTTPDKKNPAFYGSHIPFIKPGDIYPEFVNYDNEGLSESGLNDSGRFAPSGSVLMVCIGTIGKTNIIDRGCSFNQQINSITPLVCVPEFIALYLRSPEFQLEAWERSSSTTISILNKGKWEEIPLALPPLAEQSRIVTRVTALRRLCAHLRQRLAEREAVQARLAEALVQEVA